MVEQNEFSHAGFSLSGRLPGEISRSGAVDTASAPAVQDKVVTPETKIDTKTLITKRLTLRAPNRRDREALVRHANNPRVAKNLDQMPHPYTLEDADHWINELSQPAHRKRAFAITDRYTDAFIGGCGYRSNPDTNDGLYIGYWLAEAFWGQGMAAEATQALVDHAFESETIDTVWVRIRTSNHQSKRVAEKCGFQFIRSGMAETLTGNGMAAVDHYAMKRSTWESLHAWGER